MNTQEQFPPALPFPPISELGRILAGVDGDYWRLDEATTAREDRPRDQKLQRLLYRRQEILRALIADLPATSMVDAAIQLGVAFSFAGDLHENQPEPEQLAKLHHAVYRIVLSVLPIVAKAAGLTMTEMDWTDAERLRGMEFGLEEAP